MSSESRTALVQPPSFLRNPPTLNPVNWLGMWTLFAREVRRFIKVYSQTILAPVITTLLFLAVFALSLEHRPLGEHAVSFLEFLAPGLIMMAMVQNAFANTSSSLAISKIQGNIVDLLMAPLSPFEQLAAYVGGGVVRGLAVGVAVSLAMLPFVPFHVAMPSLVIYHAVMGSLMLSLLGLMGGIWAEKFDHLAAVTTFVITPLSFLSGTFYSIEKLPASIRDVAMVNPFFYMIDGFRAGFIGHADGSLEIGAAVMLTTNAVLILMAWKMLASGYKLRA
jgi:ABC-2 type transport system permease protein